MEPVKTKRWRFREADEALVQTIQRESEIPYTLARILAARGVAGPEAVREFFAPQLSSLHDPFLLKGMEAAVSRLIDAAQREETICVYGDYDVDGITSVALLTSFFRSIGLTCFFHIPHRLEDGYGLSEDGLREVAEQGARVVVSVDCGITAVAEALVCRELGVDLIITDHHTPEETLPEAFTVINPHCSDDSFPFKPLAGVGVAFNLMMALRQRLRDVGWFAQRNEPNLKEYLDLVALGTIADVVPLQGENRTFVKFGLRELTCSARIGIRALKEISGVSDEVNCSAVAFRMAPRLNAAGRLNDAAPGVELLLETDYFRALAVARSLDEGNAERQAVEQEIVRDVLQRIKSDPALKGRRSIVLASEAWHPGVIGIVASRLVELFHRPTVLIAIHNGAGKGSGRSIPGFHLYDALQSCSEHLLKFGGHKQAAGLSIEIDRLETFVERFDEIVTGLLTPDDLVPELFLDAEISPAEVTMEFARRVKELEPFGMGNPEPVFMLKGIEIVDRRELKEKHLKLRLRSGGNTFDAIGFNMASAVVDEDCVDIAFVPDINRWNGRESLQLRIKGIRPHSGVSV